MRHRETTSDPMNSVGKQVMAECEYRNVTYKFACVNKIRPICDIVAEKLEEHFERTESSLYILPTDEENILGIDPYSIDPKYPPGDPRRYGAS